MLQLDIMAYPEGHKEYKYDENKPDEIKMIRELIIEKLRLGFVVYGGNKGEDMIRVLDFDTIAKAPNKNALVEEKLHDLDRFIVNKEITRRVIRPVMVGG
jgi:citrate lyase synthetase